MKRLIAAMTLFSAGTIYTLPAFGAGKEAEFFSGVILLQASASLPAEQKAAKYRELQKITGITGTKAKALLAFYRNNPDKWKSLSGSIQAQLNEIKPPLPASGAETVQKNSR
jgi:hypothetical protein